MLEVISMDEFREESLNLESHVISIVWGRTDLSPSPLYWRTGDFDRSLLEIGLEEQTGILISVTLTLVSFVANWEANHLNLRNANLPLRRGVPICNIANWNLDSSYKSQFLDEPNELRLYTASDRASIQIGSDAAISHSIAGERIIFGITENNLLSLIQITELTSQEITAINSIFPRK